MAESVNTKNSNDNGDRYPTWKWVVAFSIMIIGFLTTQGISSISARISDQENANKALITANQAVCDRVTKIEANYSFIVTGISDLKTQIAELKTQNKELATSLIAHEKSVKSYEKSVRNRD
jgi:peptidoglycan hydrolase CwlO-like protein